MTKYIFITGGVVSGLGKGIVAASIANLLSRLNFNVSIIKCDPYINVDPGTLNPNEHGEVFVTHDGGETDLDIGHYERFLCSPVSKLSSISTGSIYNSVISKERKGFYKGSTVQIFHITSEIKNKIFSFSSSDCDFIIVEIGGTIGDLESLPFIEAARQIQSQLGFNTVCSIHCTYIPFLSCSGEFKTKPTQHSVKELRSLGLSPDILITRTEGSSLPSSLLQKVAAYSYISPSNVINCPTLSSLYSVPSSLLHNGILSSLSSQFNIPFSSSSLSTDSWDSLYSHDLEDLSFPFPKFLNIAIIGKYTHKDAYISVIEALKHSAKSLSVNINICFIDSNSPCNLYSLNNMEGVIIPGGFGKEGISSILSYLTFLRNNNIPTLGICLGMQLMVTEFAKSLINPLFTTKELSEDSSSLNIVDFLPEQYDGINIGGTLRKGTFPIKLSTNSLSFNSYNTSLIYERHRHRYEINNIYRSSLIEKGLVISGTSLDDRLIEIIELPSHPFYVGTQFHPEFSSNPISPHPLFSSFLYSLYSF